MTTMKKASTVAAIAGLLGLVAATGSAIAATTFQAYEITTSVQFTGNGGPGSTITVQANLVNPGNHAVQIGTKSEFCVITGYNAQGQLLWCTESLTITGQGMLWAQGEINRTLLEAGNPQTIAVFAGSGAYLGKTGTETIQQVVFPDEFLLTITLN